MYYLALFIKKRTAQVAYDLKWWIKTERLLRSHTIIYNVDSTISETLQYRDVITKDY